jgi:hypothetical protein
MIDLKINSAPGSGTTYCSTILEKAFGQWFPTTHQPHLLGEGNQVFILRSPYAAILSGLERHFQFIDSPDLQKFDINDEAVLKNKVKYYNTLYNVFLDDYNQDNVYACVYEDMRDNPLGLAQRVSLKFGIPLVATEITNDWVEEKLVSNLSDPNYPIGKRNRYMAVPEKEILKAAVESSEIVKQTYDRYWEHKSKIAVN